MTKKCGKISTVAIGCKCSPGTLASACSCGALKLQYSSWQVTLAPPQSPAEMIRGALAKARAEGVKVDRVVCVRSVRQALLDNWQATITFGWTLLKAKFLAPKLVVFKYTDAGAFVLADMMCNVNGLDVMVFESTGRCRLWKARKP